MSTEYLRQRGKAKTWYIRVPVPLPAQAAVGQPEIVRSLKVTSLSEAKKLRPAAMTSIYEYINEKVKAQQSEPHSANRFKHQMVAVVRDHDRGLIDDDELSERQEILLEKHLAAKAEFQGVRRRPLHPEDVRTTAAEERTIQAGFDLATGHLLLSDAIEQYIEKTRGKLADDTIETKERTLLAFQKYLGDVPVSKITKKQCAGFLIDELDTEGRSRKTVAKALSELGSLWTKHLIPLAEAEVNPVSGLTASLPSPKRGTKPTRRPWSQEELASFTKGIQEHPKQADLGIAMLLFAYMGMRREELVSLQTQDIDGDCIRLDEAKSTAGVRNIPIHPTVRPLVDHLIETSTDGYQLPTKRSARDVADSMGKRFVRWRRELGAADPATDIHALRYNFTSASENAEIPDSTTKVIVGHARSDITYGLYSPANSVKWSVLVDAMAKVSHGKFDGVGVNP